MPETKIEPKKEKKPDFFAGLGRRKRAIARAWVFDKKEDFSFKVNEKPIEEYFLGEEAKIAYLEPFYSVGVSHPQSRFSASVKVSGGGKEAQLDAVVLAFSRALVSMNPEYKPALRKKGLLTRDSREVERKKPYLRKARKSPQYSKR